MSRQKRLAVNRRAVEIMVAFVGRTEAEAVTQLTQLLVKRATGFQAFEENVRRTGRFYGRAPGFVPPCDQVRDFLASFDRPSSPPPCDAETCVHTHRKNLPPAADGDV